MTAEEKLKELRCHAKAMGYEHADPYFLIDQNGRVNISADDMDLIANLVVERLKNE